MRVVGLALLTCAAAFAGGCEPPDTPGNPAPPLGPSEISARPRPVAPRAPERLSAPLLRAIDERLSAVREQPSDPRRHARLGSLYEANRLFEEARECFAAAAALEPAEPMWPHHEAICRAALYDFEGAGEALRELVGRFPDFAPGVHRLAALELEAGDQERAEQGFRRAVALVPDSAVAQASLGEVLLARGAHEEALRALERAVELDPDYGSAHFLLGTVLMRLGFEDRALGELRLGSNAERRPLGDSFSERLPQLEVSLDAERSRAQAELEAGFPEQAQSRLEALLAARPDDVRARVNLAGVLQQLGQPDQALAHLARAVEEHPDEPAVLRALAAARLQRGEADEALVWIERSLALLGDYPDSHALHADVLTALGRPSEALAALGEAVRVAPTEVFHLGRLAHAQIQAGDMAAARSSFERLCALWPDRWEAWADLARASFALGDLPAARAAFARVRQLAPDEQTVADIEGLLAEDPR